jgi:hypothetical protein
MTPDATTSLPDGRVITNLLSTGFHTFIFISSLLIQNKVPRFVSLTLWSR